MSEVIIVVDSIQLYNLVSPPKSKKSCHTHLYAVPTYSNTPVQLM